MVLVRCCDSEIDLAVFHCSLLPAGKLFGADMPVLKVWGTPAAQSVILHVRRVNLVS